MSKIVFFSIPAYGHTNPTIEVIRELVRRGNIVRYYSFHIFQEKIEDAGAEFFSCDKYLPPMPPDIDKRSGYDFSSLIGMVTDVTINMEKQVKRELVDFQPDCIVSDSLCIWGKLFASSLHIPMIGSTTSFAFNKNTAKLMKPEGREVFYTILGFPRISKKIRLLKEHGYDVSDLTQMIRNDDVTPTIVYTSRAFQPRNEEFGSNYAFVGPSINPCEKSDVRSSSRPLIYISLGTVMKNPGFYRECIDALRDCEYDVIMSVGSQEMLETIEDIPANFQVSKFVPQLQVLQNADIFLTHCGMNSVHESIYFGVPMILFPQQSEQRAVANRLREMGAGVPLKKASARAIRDSIKEVLSRRQDIQEKLKELADSFLEAGGPKKAADFIEQSSCCIFNINRL